MRKAAMAACVVLVVLMCSAPARAEGGAVEVNSAELLEKWDQYDGREVIFRGEAVGDVMRRGGMAWITVNDDHYSREARLEAGELRGGNSGIAVWLPEEEAAKIGVLGRYGSKGDLVEVRGVFNADCREHGGDLDIHAVSLEVLEPGRRLDAAPDAGKHLAAFLSGLFLLATMVPYLRRRTRELRKARALLRDEAED